MLAARSVNVRKVLNNGDVCVYKSIQGGDDETRHRAQSTGRSTVALVDWQKLDRPMVPNHDTNLGWKLLLRSPQTAKNWSCGDIWISASQSLPCSFSMTLASIHGMQKYSKLEKAKQNTKT